MILVVGGAGYLGSCVVDELEIRNEMFQVYDNLLYRDHYLRKVHFIRGDVTDTAKLQQALKDIDVVIWLAALVGDGVCMIDPGRARAVNQESVEWLSKNFNGKIIFTSTCSVYGHSNWEADESSSLNPLSIYAETKVAAERYLRTNAEKPIILRLGTLHGWSDRMRFDLVVNAMARDGWAKGSVKVYGGMQKRPLLAVSDAAETIVDLATERKDLSRIYNLASENLTVSEIGEKVAKTLRVPVRHLEMATEDLRDYSVTSARARDYIPFNPQSHMTTSAQIITSFLATGRLRNPFSSRYSNQEAYKWNQR